MLYEVTLLNGIVYTYEWNRTVKSSDDSLVNFHYYQSGDRDPQHKFLLWQSFDFLTAITNNQEVSSILLLPLIKLGLPNLMASLLAGELSELGVESKPERYSWTHSLFLLIILSHASVLILPSAFWGASLLVIWFLVCFLIIFSRSSQHLACTVISFLPLELIFISACVSYLMMLLMKQYKLGSEVANF